MMDLKTLKRAIDQLAEEKGIDASKIMEAIEASIAADPDEAGAVSDWTRAVKGLPPGKEPVKLRIDADVLRWFRGTGKGYQTRMNNVLRAFVDSRKSAGR